MNKLQPFSVECFLSFSGENLVEYVEPFLIQQNAIPGSTYQSLRSILANLDDDHTLYALEVCTLLHPSDFLKHLIAFLAHSDSSVCCAACRLILQIPHSLVTTEIVGKIALAPIVDVFNPKVNSEGRVRAGTNKVLISELLAKFAGL